MAEVSDHQIEIHAHRTVQQSAVLCLDEVLGHSSIEDALYDHYEWEEDDVHDVEYSIHVSGVVAHKAYVEQNTKFQKMAEKVTELEKENKELRALIDKQADPEAELYTEASE